MSRYDKSRNALRGLLADWYGCERGDVELAGHGSQPRPLGQSVEAVLNSVRRPELSERLQIESRWQEIAGTLIAPLAVPANFRDSVLELEVRHSALIAELTPSLDLLKNKLHTILPQIACKEIRLIISGSVTRKRRYCPKISGNDLQNGEKKL